jgi:uncharacterized membrane protein (UPF0127 family)
MDDGSPDPRSREPSARIDRMRRHLALALAAATLTACGSAHGCPDPASSGHITFAGGGVLTVRIADEPDERARGLMGVTDLPTDEGMAFLYGESTDATFWMKDTPIPLSIAFVDQDNRIVTIREMTPCTDDVACRTYASTEPYTKAIEAEAGWFAAHGIEEGDRIRSFDGPFCY